MSKQFKLGLLVVLLIVVGTVGFYYYQSGGEEQLSPKKDKNNVGLNISQAAPDFSLTNLKGEEAALSDYRGKYVILNFWASWCPPCRQEMPHLNEFYQENKEDFVVLAVDLGETQAKVKEFIDSGGYSFPVLLDQNRKVGTNYNISVIPTSYFLGPQGKIKYIKKGAVSKAELNQIKNNIQQ